MLNIVLCDDDKFILQLEKEQILNIIEQDKIEAQIVCATIDSQDVFHYVCQNKNLSYLAFLDLDFGQGKLNGIDVARRLKQDLEQVKIVFVTNHQEMAMKVLSSGVEPFGFLEKTTDIKKLSNGYMRYIQMGIAANQTRVEEREEIILTTGLDEQVKIQRDQIVYLESEKTVSHGITYHTMDESTITVRDTMENCMEKLGKDFLRVHRSLLVNQKYILALHGNQIRLANGEEIPCAVRMISEVKKCLN